MTAISSAITADPQRGRLEALKPRGDDGGAWRAKIPENSPTSFFFVAGIYLGDDGIVAAFWAVAGGNVCIPIAGWKAARCCCAGRPGGWLGHCTG